MGMKLGLLHLKNKNVRVLKEEMLRGPRGRGE
jgi:hypothetical protein